MTVKEAAERLEVSQALVYKLLHAGRIAHHRIGMGRGVIRIDEESFEAFKRGCQVGLASDDEGPVVKKVRGQQLVIPDGFARVDAYLERTKGKARQDSGKGLSSEETSRWLKAFAKGKK